VILGVVGAGTMGAGIAQLGCAAGMRTVLHDPLPGAVEAGEQRVRAGLERWAAKGRVDASAAELLETAAAIEGLSACELVIEAAPERPELKRELFEQLSAVCGPDTVLATNTSSIPVTSLAGAAERPENVVGMHFFNPPPLMELLEVIRADQTSERTLALARETGEAMGKRVILAADGPGFLVNRCGRPFNGEGLRLLAERIATPEQIDRICRLGGGFRMGPFELMDLVGIDVGFAVAQSFAELSFGEPRWRPSPIQAHMVAAGRLGRKTGRGFYDYAEDGSYRPPDPEPLEPGGGAGRVLSIRGDGAIAEGLRERALQAGFRLPDAQPNWEKAEPTHLTIEAGPRPPWAAGASVQLCAASSLSAGGARGACGFHLLPPLESAGLVELTRNERTRPLTAEKAEEVFGCLGFHPEWVEDAPGLVLGRIVAQLVNEAYFAIGEGVGSADDVDAGLRLGLGHPRGPVEWGEAIGLDHVMAILDGLWAERREERYRPAPQLSRATFLRGAG
jgi:3-hydroxybutyryl-CoA dehydrogenase